MIVKYKIILSMKTISFPVLYKHVDIIYNWFNLLQLRYLL